MNRKEFLSGTSQAFLITAPLLEDSFGLGTGDHLPEGRHAQWIQNPHSKAIFLYHASRKRSDCEKSLLKKGDWIFSWERSDAKNGLGDEIQFTENFHLLPSSDNFYPYLLLSDHQKPLEIFLCIYDELKNKVFSVCWLKDGILPYLTMSDVHFLNFHTFANFPDQVHFSYIDEQRYYHVVSYDPERKVFDRLVVTEEPFLDDPKFEKEQLYLLNNSLFQGKTNVFCKGSFGRGISFYTLERTRNGVFLEEIASLSHGVVLNSPCHGHSQIFSLPELKEGVEDSCHFPMTVVPVQKNHSFLCVFNSEQKNLYGISFRQEAQGFFYPYLSMKSKINEFSKDGVFQLIQLDNRVAGKAHALVFYETRVPQFLQKRSLTTEEFLKSIERNVRLIVFSAETEGFFRPQEIVIHDEATEKTKSCWHDFLHRKNKFKDVRILPVSQRSRPYEIDERESENPGYDFYLVEREGPRFLVKLNEMASNFFDITFEDMQTPEESAGTKKISLEMNGPQDRNEPYDDRSAGWESIQSAEATEDCCCIALIKRIFRRKPNPVADYRVSVCTITTECRRPSEGPQEPYEEPDSIQTSDPLEIMSKEVFLPTKDFELALPRGIWTSLLMAHGPSGFVPLDEAGTIKPPQFKNFLNPLESVFFDVERKIVVLSLGTLVEITMDTKFSKNLKDMMTQDIFYQTYPRLKFFFKALRQFLLEKPNRGLESVYKALDKTAQTFPSWTIIADFSDNSESLENSIVEDAMANAVGASRGTGGIFHESLVHNFRREMVGFFDRLDNKSYQLHDLIALRKIFFTGKLWAGFSENKNVMQRFAMVRWMSERTYIALARENLVETSKDWENPKVLNEMLQGIREVYFDHYMRRWL